MTNTTNKNTINDLREILFEQIRALKDKDKTPDIPRAKAIADISQVMINSVKSEIDFYKITGQKISSSFLPDQPEEDITLEKRFMPNGNATCRYSIATSETWKDKNGEKQERTE